MLRLFRRHMEENGLLGGVVDGLLVFSPVFVGAALGIQWLMWLGIGLFVLVAGLGVYAIRTDNKVE